MIVHKLDPQTNADANKKVRDMGTVLSEIVPTLRVLRDLLSEHENSISVPSLDNYREEIQKMIPEAMRLAHLIAVYSQRLTTVSDEATKQLLAVDTTVRTALMNGNGQTAPIRTQTEGTTATKETQSPRFFLRSTAELSDSKA